MNGTTSLPFGHSAFELAYRMLHLHSRNQVRFRTDLLTSDSVLITVSTLAPVLTTTLHRALLSMCY